jgi:hypothetical protein
MPYYLTGKQVTAITWTPYGQGRSTAACLMTNDVHLLLAPEKNPAALAPLMKVDSTHWRKNQSVPCFF